MYLIVSVIYLIHIDMNKLFDLGVPENRTSPHINRTSPHINGNSDVGINANDDITLAFQKQDSCRHTVGLLQ